MKTFNQGQGDPGPRALLGMDASWRWGVGSRPKEQEMGKPIPQILPSKLHWSLHASPGAKTDQKGHLTHRDQEGRFTKHAWGKASSPPNFETKYRRIWDPQKEIILYSAAYLDAHGRIFSGISLPPQPACPVALGRRGAAAAQPA